MKVYISKYRDHWISPYTMLDYLFWWTDWSKCSRWKLSQTLEDEAATLKGAKSRYVERPSGPSVGQIDLYPLAGPFSGLVNVSIPKWSMLRLTAGTLGAWIIPWLTLCCLCCAS